MKWIAFDTETTGLNPWLGAEIFAFSTCDEDENIEVHRLDGKDGKSGKAGKAKLLSLMMAAMDGAIGLVMANAKFDLRMTEHLFDMRIAEHIQYHDVLIQSHILRNDHPNHRLKDLAWEYGSIPKDDEKAIKPYVYGYDAKTGNETVDYSLVPAHLMHEYQRQDAIRTMLLHLFFWPKIEENELWKQIYSEEMKLILTTLRMEERGVLLNQKRCIALADQLASEAEDVLDECEEYMGRRINLGNDSRVRELLFQDLEFESDRVTGSGLPSVDKDALRGLKGRHDHPVLNMVLKYRSYTKGSTMLRGYLALADENSIIHPDIRTCGAGTGRESCSKPNLQNVAKEKSYLNPYPVPARRVFVPRPGYVNFYMDYKGIQFRLAIILTGDEKLLSFVSQGLDLHVLGAELLLPKLWNNASPEEREIIRGSMKNANFAKMFGAGLAKVSECIGQPVTKEDFKRYDSVFGPLDKSAKRMVAFARKHGYIDTVLGRRLYTPAHKPYVATNYCIQGSEADILKPAQNRAHKYLEEKTGGAARLLLMVHDEIVIEWPRSLLSEAPKMLSEVRELMIDFPQLGAPLDVDVEVATVDWSKKKGFELCTTSRGK